MCESTIRAVEVRDQHCSGEWNERIEFLCRTVIVYSPNFCRVQVASGCPNAHEMYVKMKGKTDE